MGAKVVLEAKRSLGPLFHADCQGDWQRIPQWALFSFELGMALASTENKRGRLTLGLSVPTRAYVALLVTLGMISGRCSPHDEEEDLGNFLKKVQTLPMDMEIETVVAGHWERGRFRGIQKVKGQDCMRIELGSKHKSCKLLPLDDRLPFKIFGCPDFYRSDESSANYSEMKIRAESTFSLFFVNKSQALDFALKDRLEHAIVGNAKILKAELKEQIFAVKVDNQFVEGRLSAVIRGSFDGEKSRSCRTRILSSRSRNVDAILKQEMPLFTVFDGALAFLKWGNCSYSGHRVVVLDMTQPQFQEAVTTLTDVYTSRRTKVELEFRLKTKLPPSMDVIAFMEDIA